MSGPVKRGLLLGLMLILPGLTMGCQSAIGMDFSAAKSPQPFEEHEDYLAMPISYAPIAKVRKEFEERHQLSLKNRGEAHVTVLTPPEFKALQGKISIQEINEIAKKNSFSPADLSFLCLGRGELVDKELPEKKLETFFIVVKSEKLEKIRSEIEDLFKKRQEKLSSLDPVQKFSASPYYPHITLGFTDRDLHESDGVIKDRRSCVLVLENMDSQ